MSVMHALVLLAQATTPSGAAIFVPAPMPPVPMPSFPIAELQKMTLPLIKARCELEDRARRKFILELQQTGGRAYSTTRPFFGPVGTRTEPKVSVVRDDTNEFDNRIIIGTFDYLLSGNVRKSSQAQFNARSMSESLSVAVLSVEKVFDDNQPEDIIGSKPYLNSVYLGYCSVERKPQLPLSAQETSELEKK